MGRWRASLILSNMARIITIPKSTNPNISPHLLNPLRLLLSSNSTNRFFSALPSPSPIYDNDFYYRLPNFDALDSKQDLDTPKIPIKAYFLCTRYVGPRVHEVSYVSCISQHVIFVMSLGPICTTSLEKTFSVQDAHLRLRVMPMTTLRLMLWSSGSQALPCDPRIISLGLPLSLSPFLVALFLFFLILLSQIHDFGSIDLKSMHAENSSNVVPPTSRSSNYIALRFCNFPSKTTGIRIEENVSCCHYMVVFQYGSAVLFNVEDHEIEFYLEIVRRHASGLLPEMRKDDYAVKEKPTLIEDMQGGPDYIVLKNLDTDSIRIIGSVLGQSIALDYFVSQVDGMVEEFTDINRGMEKTGTFTMKRKKLFQLVGKANSNLADVILKVGLFDRSEIAWRDAKYSQIFEYLRDEYEVTQRFGNLDFKLKFVEAQREFSSSPPFYRLVGDPLFLVRIGYLEEQRGSCA
ncbi:hypothetical protein TEA_000774 [Camellia sinensis var. sinensis]|uniref:DUF155 domain-containing protein n=1 Tax=Camellia sinensis var. sinensis TaxID=542762 RepID=A0A4S4E2S2_CAMSN|nr:hypothetical protein TEA_000774 [Camellia sinensis var. sinensis]